MKHYLMSICFAILTVTVAAAQEKQTVSLPPKPADDGPSLEATMKFIQEKMNGEEGAKIPGIGVGKLAVSAGPVTCTLQGVLGITSNPVKPQESTFLFSFQDVKEITVQDYWAWANITPTTESPAFLLTLSAEETAFTQGPDHFVNGKSPISATHQKTGKDEKVRRLLFIIRDEDLANRVAKAMLHAVELCGGGGGKSEPF